MQICERNNSADANDIAEGGAGGLCSGVEIPLHPMAKTMAGQAVPLQAREVHGGAGRCPKEAVTAWEAHTGADCLQDL